jgi:hypothetical protein
LCSAQFFIEITLLSVISRRHSSLIVQRNSFTPDILIHRLTKEILPMNAQAPKIVHESEAQRQFIRLKLPARATLGGIQYQVNDLSAGGLSLLSVQTPPKAGEKFPLELTLPFQDYSMDVQLEAEVEHYDADQKMLGCRFVNLNASQLSVLNHVLRAFIAGDVVAAGDREGS